ncbi:MAG: sulfotransferase family 2 domain-containing protein [Lutimonas sp.]
MLISDSHQFIFVHIRKAAGSSIRDTLEPLSLVKPTDTWSKIKSRFLKTETDYKKYAFRQHDDINVAKRLMPPDLFESYFKFAFVRNPWDRLVSEYEFIRRRPDHGRHSKVMRMGFEKYIVYQSKRFDAHQINMLADKNGKLLMDFIGKFENLYEDWNRITDRLGIENKQLTHRKKAGIKDYNSYYSDESRALVAELWKGDIEAFGYHQK